MAPSKRSEPTATGATQVPEGELVELTRSDLESGQVAEGRLRGLGLGKARLEEARFKSCKLDYANFRHAVVEHVSFEDCVLTNATSRAPVFTRRLAATDGPLARDGP